MKVAAIIGSPAPSRRTRAAIERVTVRMAEAGADVELLDLHQTPLPQCDGRAWAEVEPARLAVDLIAAADKVVIGSPVYRAAPPGALKNLLDWTPLEALQGKPVGLVVSGGSAHHYLMIDLALRPLLAWFNADPLPGGVYLHGEDFDAEGRFSDMAANSLDALADALFRAAPRAPLSRGF